MAGPGTPDTRPERTGGLDPCPRCHYRHPQLSFAEWTWTWRDHVKDKPPGKFGFVVLMIASRMSPRTGCGWNTREQVAADSGVTEKAVSDATRWAMDHKLLYRLVRGHRKLDGGSTDSLWCLTDPTTSPDGYLVGGAKGRAGQPTTSPHGDLVDDPAGSPTTSPHGDLVPDLTTSPDGYLVGAGPLTSANAQTRRSVHKVTADVPTTSPHGDLVSSIERPGLDRPIAAAAGTSTNVDAPATASANTDDTSSANTDTATSLASPAANGSSSEDELPLGIPNGGSASQARDAAMAARRAEVVRLTVEGLSQKDIAKRLGIGPAAVRNDQRKSGVKPSRDTEDAELNGRAGAVTDAWAKTQAAGLVSDQGRHSVHQLVKRVLAAGQFDDDATGAALLRLADRGIAPTAAALGRELTGPAHANGKGSSQQRHQPYRAPADQSVYDRGFTKR